MILIAFIMDCGSSSSTYSISLDLMVALIPFWPVPVVMISESATALLYDPLILLLAESPGFDAPAPPAELLILDLLPPSEAFELLLPAFA